MDLVVPEQEELAVLMTYLPQPLGQSEIEAIVRQVIAETGASAPADLGLVMRSGHAAPPGQSRRQDRERNRARVAQPHSLISGHLRAMSTLPASGPTSPLERLPASVSWRDRLTALAFGAVFVALTTATLTIQWPTGGRFTLQTGEVSPADIRAPQSVEYISDSLTEEARKDAERRVADVYEPARRARSEQIARSNEVLDVIEAVRNDESISLEQKTEALQALPDVQLEPGDWQLLLLLDDEAWKRVRTEAPAVINAVMLAEIRETQLAAVMRNVPNYVNSENDDEARLSTALARTFIKPNMLLNESRTQAAQAEARAAVAPQIERYEAGEIILREGDLVTVHHLEALNALGLNEPGWNLWRLVSSLIVSLVLALYLRALPLPPPAS